MRLIQLALMALVSLTAMLVPVHACSLALVVAMDGSSSVDDREHRQQLQGLAHALRDAEVVDAIQAVGGIWFSSFEWSGRHKQQVQVGWRFLNSAGDADAAADQLSNARRGFTEFPTALGYALGYASVHLRKVPQECLRLVIDVAGDGINNEGFGPRMAYDAFDFTGITVNALAIAGADPDPIAYYQQEVVRGAGAFVEVANGFDDYTRAMKRKLLREILFSLSAEGPHPPQVTVARADILLPSSGKNP
ncbi:DUF1194 domain-containing protein [Roseibium limicola]|nr:DUF1194 domain-containing protein [Roseibium limicola]